MHCKKKVDLNLIIVDRMGKEKVAYFYDAEIGNYHYGPGNMVLYHTVI